MCTCVPVMADIPGLAGVLFPLGGGGPALATVSRTPLSQLWGRTNPDSRLSLNTCVCVCVCEGDSPGGCGCVVAMHHCGEVPNQVKY